MTNEDTITPSPKLQESSPIVPNAPSKTPSTKDTSSSSIDYTPKSPTLSSSPSTNGYLNPPLSPPPRVPLPPLTQAPISMEITLSLSPITPFDVHHNSPSLSPPIIRHPIPWNLLEAHVFHNLEENKDCLLNERFTEIDGSWVLSSAWRSSPPGRSCNELNLLYSITDSCSLNSGVPDGWKWTPDLGKDFTVKSLSHMVNSILLEPYHSEQKFKWNSWVPQKINIFAWRAFNDRLPFLVNLDNKGLDAGSVLCPFCSNAPEDANQLLTSCPRVVTIGESFLVGGRLVEKLFSILLRVCLAKVTVAGTEDEAVDEDAIQYATPLSFLYETLAFVILSLFAFFVEIVVESHGSALPFNTRPGASSGILLGAVTLPGLAVSKLIQLRRGLLVNEVTVEDVAYIRLQYWATSTSCLFVLVFLYFICRHEFNKNKPVSLHRRWHTKFSIGCIALFAAMCYLSLAARSPSGRYITLSLLWVVIHGLAAVKFIQHVLQTFPACASFGEALLVTAGSVVYFGDMSAFTIAKISIHLVSYGLRSITYGVERSEICTIIQGMLLGLLLSPMLFKFILQRWELYTTSSNAEARGHHESGRSTIFYGSLAFTVLAIAPFWMQFVQDFSIHPFLWVLKFVFSEPHKRLSLCIYWVAVISASVLRFYNISKNSKIERILLRKYYHLVAVLMFVPALVFQPSFLNLAFGAAFGVFLVLEIIRVWRIWPLGQIVHQFMNAFTDHRDSDLLIVSHFSLLLGCALPIWMSSGFNDRPLAPFAGILSLGIGDTMASMVGYKYGVLRWSKTGKKTVEGTAAGITSVLAACSALLPLLAATGHMFTQHWLSLLLAVTVSGLLEAYTAQLDNAFIPLVFYSLLCL
ncbi:dolichol kinase EVAN [Tanacetum coccineum]